MLSKGDSLTWHVGQKFSTPDQDNDPDFIDHCAVSFHGAWWFKNCYQSNLNGRYQQGVHDDGVTWWHWKHNGYSMRVTEMKIRPFSFN